MTFRASSLLTLPPNLQRRIWFIIDELPIFQKLQALDSLITEGRKYGACALLALQSPAQLEEIYGRASAQTILGNCATRLIFAEQDPETAHKISHSLGETEIKEYQEGISYGAYLRPLWRQPLPPIQGSPPHLSHPNPIPPQQPRLPQTPWQHSHYQAFPQFEVDLRIFLNKYEGIVFF